MTAVGAPWEDSRRLEGWASDATHVLLPAERWSVPETPGLLAVDFDVPSDAPGTDLLSLPAHTWHLVVSLETPEGVWIGQVPAPVFARAAAAPAAADRRSRRVESSEDAL